MPIANKNTLNQVSLKAIYTLYYSPKLQNTIIANTSSESFKDYKQKPYEVIMIKNNHVIQTMIPRDTHFKVKCMTIILKKILKLTVMSNNNN